MLKIEIVYEDADILVLYKPAGLATQTARVSEPDVCSQLRSHLKGGYVGMVHRLDQPVEGLLVFGKNKRAAASLASQLTGGGLGKEYYAATCGPAEGGERKLTDYLRQDGRGGVQVAAPEEQGGKRAVLSYRRLADRSLALPSGERVQAHLLRVRLETGRLHQIRAQLAHHGMPLLGDGRYGSAESKRISSLLGLRQTALCAYRLSLRHPVDGRKMEWKAEPGLELLRGMEEYE